MMGGDWACRVLGRAVTLPERLKPSRVAVAGELDKTGRLVERPKPAEFLFRDGQVTFVDYDSLAHSFWRAQEFSLFEGHRGLLKEPVLDFGCGDGSFASVLFPKVAYGVDRDPQALETARQYGIYGTLAEGADALPSGCAGSVFSNSVLEHVGDLDAVLSEIHRLLAPGGAFLFTAPVQGFSRHLRAYFGASFERRINREYYHRNLLEPGEWKGLLERHGFLVERIVEFQPPHFTFWYVLLRFLGRRKGIGRVCPRAKDWAWRRWESRMIRSVRDSIAGTEDGANVFVIARRPA